MKTLFDKVSINNIEIKNRLIRSATWEGIADTEGHIYDNFIEFYDTLSNGGIGLIISGYSTVFSYDKPSENISGIYDDSFIDDYKKVTSTVHSNNCKIFMQIVLGKDYKNTEDNFSSYNFEDNMKKEYIAEIIDAFSNAALRAKKANFDGIQLHCAHGYFLSRTLSPLYNSRTDDYGINKSKLIIEIYNSVRKTVGDDFVVGIKINCHDNIENGATFKECLDTCTQLDKLGLDFIEISGKDFYNPKYKNKECIYKDYASTVSNNVSCPVSVVALNRTPNLLEDILNSTNINFISLCRPTICEPNLPNRWKSGDFSKAKCISCGKCYVDSTGNRCILNKDN